MRMVYNAQFLAALLGLVAPLSPAFAQDAPAGCVASIELSRSEYSNGSSLSPRLLSPGVQVLYVPKTRDGRWGYRVEQVAENTNSSAALTPEIVSLATRSLLYPSEKYVLADPPLLKIGWREVGRPTTKHGASFEVSPGTYRLSLLVSNEDPSKSHRESVSVCKVYSRPFVLTQVSSWTTYE